MENMILEELRIKIGELTEERQADCIKKIMNDNPKLFKIFDVLRYYLQQKNIVFPTYKAMAKFFEDNMNCAEELAEYTNEQIAASFEYAKDHYTESGMEWKLSTILKTMPEVISKKNLIINY